MVTIGELRVYTDSFCMSVGHYWMDLKELMLPSLVMFLPLFICEGLTFVVLFGWVDLLWLAMLVCIMDDRVL